MKQKYSSFFFRLTFATLLIGLAGWTLMTFLPENSISPAFFYVLLLFYLVTAAMHMVLLRITQMNPRRFVSYFMLATFIKLIIYFLAVLVYVFNFREHVLSFIVTFFVLYVFFTVFEVVFLMKQTREI